MDKPTLRVSAANNQGVFQTRLHTATAAAIMFRMLRETEQYMVILVHHKRKCIRYHCVPQIRRMPTFGKGRVNIRLQATLARLIK